MRIGHGYDAHKLAPGRDLVLCGVKIPFGKGLDGHSDADAPVHALMDALLGAAGLRDIGHYFPADDEAYRGRASVPLLESAAGLVGGAGYKVLSADITIIAQEPKLAPYIEQMRLNLEGALRAPVNVKATTEEGMGFSGRGEGIAAHAVCLLAEGAAVLKTENDKEENDDAV